MRDLLGVILVAQFGFGGDQLIFRFPPVRRHRVTAETMADFHDKHPNHPKALPSLTTTSAVAAAMVIGTTSSNATASSTTTPTGSAPASANATPVASPAIGLASGSTTVDTSNEETLTTSNQDTSSSSSSSSSAAVPIKSSDNAPSSSSSSSTTAASSSPSPSLLSDTSLPHYLQGYFASSPTGGANAVGPTVPDGPSTSTTSTPSVPTSTTTPSSTSSTTTSTSTASSSAAVSSVFSHPFMTSDAFTALSFTDPYHLSSVIIAPMLIPKRSLCDRSFELIVDSTKFIGFPTLLINNFGEASSSSSSSSPSPSVSSSSPSSSSSSSSGKKKSSTREARDEIVVFNFLFAVRVSTHDDPSCRPSLITREAYTTQGRGRGGGMFDANNSNSMFGAGEEFETTIQWQRSRTRVYKRMSRRIAEALKHEQQRCNFLSEEVQQICGIRDEWLKAQATSLNPPDHSVLTDRILTNSRLANYLRDIFIDLTNHESTHIRINQRIQVSLSLQDPYIHPVIPMRPYHTLLLLDSPETSASLSNSDGMASVSSSSSSSSIPSPLDSSPLLRRFMETVHPTKSFNDLQLEMGLPLSQIFRMASHLVFWKKAKVIDTLTKNKLYVLNPGMTVTLDLMKEFTLKFSSFQFSQILEMFSTLKTLYDRVSSLSSSVLQRELVNVVIWMLKKEIIVQLFKFPYLLVPEREREDEGTMDNDDLDQAEIEKVFQVDVETIMQLNRREWNYLIRRVEADNNQVTSRLFKRLLPLFVGGQNHVEEIIWRGNVAREDLELVFKAYSDVIVCALHEEPNLYTLP